MKGERSFEKNCDVLDKLGFYIEAKGEGSLEQMVMAGGDLPNIVKDEDLEEFEKGNKWSHVSLVIQSFGKLYE